MRANACAGWAANWRQAAAMLVCPAHLSRPIAVSRSAAMTWGMWPQRTCERSSSKVTSRTQCDLFSIDIIANSKFLRLPAVNSKVVQCTGDLHHKIVILFFRIAEKVFDNSTSFNPGNDMLNDNPDAGDTTVLLFLFWGKLFS